LLCLKAEPDFSHSRSSAAKCKGTGRELTSHGYKIL